MRTRFTKILLTLSFLVLSIPVLRAQQISSLLIGRVMNEKNEPIPGVKVQITYLPWNRVSVGTTNEKGIYSVANLSPGGPYTVRFSMDGYEAVSRDIITMVLGNSNSLSLHMRRETANDDLSGKELVSSEDKPARTNSL